MRPSTDADRTATAANDFIVHKLQAFCPKGSIFTGSFDAKGPLRVDTALSNFGLKQGSMHTVVEKHALWTARLTISGSRQIAIFEQEAVQGFMKASGIVGKPPKDYLKEIGIAGAQQYCQQGRAVHVATISEGDMVWLPAGAVAFETVAPGADCFGLRWQMISSNDKKHYAAFQSVADSKMTPSTHVAKAIVRAASVVPTE